MTRQSVRIENGAIDVWQDGQGKEDLILRGRISPDSFHLIQSGEYQREVRPISTIRQLVEAYKTGKVPDIELGMRGDQYNEREGVYYLQDAVYVIDGLQRLSAGMEVIRSGATIPPHLGAVIHFNTKEEWERARFQVLNANRTKVSPNVLLRNARHDVEVIDLLYRFTTEDKAFLLCGRVCWQQQQTRMQIVTALVLLKTVSKLMGHLGPGRYARWDEVALGTQTIMEACGKNTFRDNVRTFFEIVDECWGVRSITFKEGAVYMRATFMEALATILSGHLTFWKDNRLTVDRDLRRKLSQFPIHDPSVKQLAGAGGQARSLLTAMIVEHLNSGKRTRRLVPRDATMTTAVTDQGADDDDGTNGDNTVDNGK